MICRQIQSSIEEILFPSISIDGRKARTILEDLCAWDVVVNDEQSVLNAIDLKAK
jgi:hypothetical protein